MPPQHHPLESDHHLHPEERDVVPAAADRSQHPREQRGSAAGWLRFGETGFFFCFNFERFRFPAVVPTDYDHLQLLRGDELFLDVRRGLLPSHRHRHDLFNR